MVTEADIEIMKSAVERLTEEIGKSSIPETEGSQKETKTNNSKGEDEEMKIDKSKLTDEERTFLESIEKKYGNEEEPQEDNPVAALEVPVTKSTAPEQVETPATEEGSEDIYKGMHPAVKAELESLKKFRKEIEAKEMQEVAKKYEVIGKKADELAPILKSLKDAGGTAYNDMIAVLDQTVEMVEKSGVFSEIGKAGHTDDNSAEAKIGVIAKSMMEKDASISYNQAVAKAWEEHPELLAEYDEQAGF